MADVPAVVLPGRHGDSVARVLVVDDDPLNVELLSAYLGDEGYRVTAAFSGAEALQHVMNATPDLVFLDAMMPDMDGFAVCTQLKTSADTRLIPVVMITALSSLQDRVRGIEAGTDDFLTKPVNRLELLTRSRSLLRIKGYVDDLESAERVIEALAKAIELRDGYTEEHTERVTARAINLGRALELSEADLMTLQRGGMLHDIGKIGIPEAILGKPGKLTHEEFAVMRQHPVKGVEICQPLRSRLVALTLPIIRHHHERIDGRGYPDGLRGEEIPLLARIIAISDAYDAMTTDRPYRQGMPKTVALGLLLQGAGSQWDRALVERFVLMERQSPGRREHETFISA
jgi:putative two-component system response regulator